MKNRPRNSSSFCDPEPIYRQMLAHGHSTSAVENFRADAHADVAFARAAGVASTISFVEATLEKYDELLAAYAASVEPLDEATLQQALAVQAHDCAFVVDASGTIDPVQAVENGKSLVIAAAARRARDTTHACACVVSQSAFAICANSPTTAEWRSRSKIFADTESLASNLWDEDHAADASTFAAEQGTRADQLVERLWPVAEERARATFSARAAEHDRLAASIKRGDSRKEMVERRASLDELEKLFATRRAALAAKREAARSILATLTEGV